MNVENNIRNVNLAANVHENVKHALLSSHVFDAEQKKLAVKKLPDRPAFKLPREYGITDSRRR